MASSTNHFLRKNKRFINVKLTIATGCCKLNEIHSSHNRQKRQTIKTNKSIAPASASSKNIITKCFDSPSPWLFFVEFIFQLVQPSNKFFIVPFIWCQSTGFSAFFTSIKDAIKINIVLSIRDAIKIIEFRREFTRLSRTMKLFSIFCCLALFFNASDGKYVEGYIRTLEVSLS